MQPYERIGLVAVLFFGVLLAVGALWDDGATENDVLAAERSEVERVDEEAAARAAAREARKAERIRLAQETARGASLQRPGVARQIPMGGQDEVGAEVSRVTTLSDGSDHRSTPLDLEAPRRDVGSQGAARAQDPEELRGFARPNRASGARSEGEAVSMNARSPRRRQGSDAPRSRGADREDRAQDMESKPAGQSAKVETTASSAGRKPRTYTVKPGDALQRIARRELGDSGLCSAIASLNGLSNPDMIRAGMVLTLPPSTAGKARVAPTSSGSTSASGAAPTGGGRSYKIKSGESLSTALTRELGTYKRSISLVKALNPGLNPDRVLAGQVIRLPRIEDIPGGSKGSTGSSSSRTRSAAPALDTSAGTATVASAERRPTAKSTRSDSEFVVR